MPGYRDPPLRTCVMSHVMRAVVTQARQGVCGRGWGVLAGRQAFQKTVEVDFSLFLSAENARQKTRK